MEQQGDHDPTRTCSEEEKKKRVQKIKERLAKEYSPIFEVVAASEFRESPELARNILVRTAGTLAQIGDTEIPAEEAQRATLIRQMALEHCADETAEGWRKVAMWERARNGDPFAREGLYLQYREFVRNKLKGMHLRPEDMEDCSQETWIRVHCSVGSAEGPELRTFEGWLGTIARHEGISFFRRQKKYREESVSQMAPDAEAMESTEEMLDMFHARENIEKSARRLQVAQFELTLEKGKTTLLPIEREILELRLEGKSEGFIAGKTKRKQSTISGRLTVITKKMSRFFKGELK